MVDQLAEWDEFSHKAYNRWARKNLILDAEDRQLLQKHAEMRKARGWGNGFEQAFLVEDTIEVAAARAVEQKLLSADEPTAEQAILQHFAPKLAALREEHKPQNRGFPRASFDGAPETYAVLRETAPLYANKDHRDRTRLRGC